MTTARKSHPTYIKNTGNTEMIFQTKDIPKKEKALKEKESLFLLCFDRVWRIKNWVYKF